VNGSYDLRGRDDPLGQAVLNLFPLPNFFDTSVSQLQYNYRDVDKPDVYRALNQLTGSSSFQTDVNAQLPFRQETVLRVTQPLFNPAIAANHGIARGHHEARLARGRDVKLA
jgi:hypothetical protein